MNDKNPYTSPQSDDGERPILVRFRDSLPPVCIVCGAAASVTATKHIELPDDPMTTGLRVTQILFALLTGAIFFWWSNRVKLERNVLRLPCCPIHSDEALRSITAQAINEYSANVYGASPVFRQAFDALVAPPTPEMLAAMDAGSGDGDFLKAIEKSSVSSPAEFLKGLEGDSSKP